MFTSFLFSVWMCSSGSDVLVLESCGLVSLESVNSSALVIEGHLPFGNGSKNLRSHCFLYRLSASLHVLLACYFAEIACIFNFWGFLRFKLFYTVCFLTFSVDLDFSFVCCISYYLLMSFQVYTIFLPSSLFFVHVILYIKFLKSTQEQNYLLSF